VTEFRVTSVISSESSVISSESELCECSRLYLFILFGEKLLGADQDPLDQVCKETPRAMFLLIHIDARCQTWMLLH